MTDELANSVTPPLEFKHFLIFFKVVFSKWEKIGEVAFRLY
jgi:hypothetical protein